MMRTMAQSPAVLDAYLAFGAALHKGLLPASLQEQIALTVAEANACDYCLSAHSALGRGAGLSSDDRREPRRSCLRPQGRRGASVCSRPGRPSR